MKKSTISIVCSATVLLLATSASAGGLLRTVDVLCNPLKNHTVIKDEGGEVLFNAHTLMAVINSRGGAGECVNSGAKNTYNFTPISANKKFVFNPIVQGEEEKIVSKVSLKPIGGDAYRGNKPVLSGKVKPDFKPVSPPQAYEAIVETGQKIIRQAPIMQPPAQTETTYRHILR